MSISKKQLKSKPICKVTFKVSKEIANNAGTACIAGDFNDWNKTSHPMKPLRDGSFSLTLDLDTGKEYAFRYVIDDVRWENDPNADKQVPTQFSDAVNSVVVT